MQFKASQITRFLLQSETINKKQTNLEFVVYPNDDEGFNWFQNLQHLCVKSTEVLHTLHSFKEAWSISQMTDDVTTALKC